MTDVAVVTGGTGALGQAITLRLLRDGLAVAVPWVVAAERDALEARAPTDARPRLLAVECNVTDAPATERLVEQVERDLGGVGVLVTAVGGFAGGALVDTDLATWNRMLDLNLTSAFVAARAVLPRMLGRRRGRIVTIASRSVVPPLGGFIGYTVAKAGVIALTQGLAQETRGTGVTVNAVLPSTMDTEANRRAMPDADRSGWVSTQDVANVVAFLLSDRAAAVSGAAVPV
jgi:NAD(P)-dependent dehydrogenase (short-subunit alcohol dehydrogenase family)